MASELILVADCPDAVLKGVGAANFLHQAHDAASREGAAHAELLLPCARGYCLHRSSDGAAASRVPLGEADAAVCALARGCGSQPCIALARAGQSRLELWRLGALLEARELPGACRALSWRLAELAVATSHGALLVRHAPGAPDWSHLLLEPRAPTLALAWLDDGGLAVAFSEDGAGACAVRVYGRGPGGSAEQQRSRPAAADAPLPPLAPQPLRTVTLDAGRVYSMCALPGSGLLALAVTRLSVSLALGQLAAGGAPLLGAGRHAGVAADGAPRAVASLGIGPAHALASGAGPEAGGADGGGADEPSSAPAPIDLTGLRARAQQGGGGGLSQQHPLFRIHADEANAARSAACAQLAAGAAGPGAAQGGPGGAGGPSAARSTACLCVLDTSALREPSQRLSACVPPCSELALCGALSSPNALAAARLSLGGRTQAGRWTVAVGSSVRSAVELLSVCAAGQASGAPTAARCGCIELPPRHSCHGLCLLRSELLVLCSRPGALPSSLFCAQYAKCALQLHAYSLRLPDQAPDARAARSPQGAEQPAAAQPRPAAPRADGREGSAAEPAARPRAAAAAETAGLEDSALGDLTRRLRSLAAAYPVDWRAAPLLSAEEAGDELVLRIRLRKSATDRP